MSTEGSNVEIYWLEHYYGNPPVAQRGRLIVEGYQLPYIELTKSMDMAHDGEVTVTLDSRLSIDTTEGQLLTWGWMLAHSMAFAAGFTCFGANARARASFFGTTVFTITSVDPPAE